MFLAGHIAAGYLLGTASSRLLKVKFNIPLLFVLSVIPEIDILFQGLLPGIHRSFVHSSTLVALAFVPIFIYYRKKAVPYFLALLAHSLICDFLIGGNVQLLWPFSAIRFGLEEIGSYYIWMFDPINIALELMLSLATLLFMVKTGDWKVFFANKRTNLLLILIIAAALPLCVSGYPFAESLMISSPVLALIHLVYVGLFGIAVSRTITFHCRKLRSVTFNA